MSESPFGNGSEIIRFEMIEGNGVVFFSKPLVPEIPDVPGLWERIMRVFRAPKLPQQNPRRSVGWRTGLNENWYGDYITLLDEGELALQEAVSLLEDQARATLQELKKKKS